MLNNREQEWVESTLVSLSLREKIGQTAQERFGGFADDHPETVQRYFEENPLGSLFCGGEIIKGAGNTADVIRDGIRLCQKASKVPLLIAGDLENGAGSAISGLTSFPHMMALGAANDKSLAYDYGRFTALEGRAAGFNWTFAPVVDLLQNWLNPVVSNRCLGDDPLLVEKLASAVIRGMQDHGLAACAKHFPGDGVDFRDQHLVTSVNSLTEQDWWRSFGRVFQSVIDVGVQSVMTGHIALRWLEPPVAAQTRVRPATVSKKIINDLLRGRLGFSGVIVTDALEMGGFTGWAPYAQRIVEAFNAGNDIMLWPGRNYVSIVENAIQDGHISLERLDESVRRILNLKASLGLLDLDAGGRDIHAVELNGRKMLPEWERESKSVAARVAGKSITLVRNRSGLVPLNPRKVKRVLLHKAVNPISDWKDSLDQLVDGIRARGIEVTVLENGNCLDIWNRETQGERWDAYLVVFSLQIHQAKNTVRPVGPMAEVMWTLQNTDTLKPIVISLGTPFLLNDMPFLDTLINCYSPSEPTVKALEKTLFDEAPFSKFSPIRTGGDWVL